eukprot:7153899-Prymnesium_polylepis.1
MAAKAEAQTALRKYAEVFGEEAADKEEIAYNVSANSARVDWPLGMDEMSTAMLPRRIGLKLRNDISEA